MRFSHAGAMFALVVTGAIAPAAQDRIPAAPPPGGPTFEVASIKRVTDVRPGGSNGTHPGGRWVLSNGAIAAMIRTAYPADTSEIVGAPEWVMSDRYDVTAKAAGDPTREQMATMLQALLAARFGLAVHYEMHERPVYALVPTRSDGRLGPGIQRSPLDCDAIRAANRNEPARAYPRADNGAPACGMSMSGGTHMTVMIGGQPLASFARTISSAAGRVVLDRTGLLGNYEITVRYSDPPSDAVDAPPTIFTALQEQLGLKLEPDRAPLRILVLDRVERPTED
jgi:uncharacterized protein (TIGR03435 family)